MKSSLAIAFTLFISIQVQAQWKIKKILIKEEGYSVRIKYNPINDQIKKDGLTLKIIPKSALEINEKFYNLSKLDGRLNYSDYESSRSSFFLKKQKKTSEKSNYNFLMEGIEYLYDNDSISKRQYDDLYNQINSRFERGTSEQELNKERVVSANPYYIKGKHLSVFELNIKNPSESFQVLRTEFLIESGDQLLKPLSTGYLASVLANYGDPNYNKLQSLEGYNLPKEIVIPPKSDITKYFAVLPINYTTEQLKISLPESSTKFKWTIEQQKNTISERYTYYEFESNWYYGGISGNDAINFYCKIPSDDIFFTDGLIYIDENSLNEEFEMTTISLYMDKIYFGTTKVVGSEALDLDRNRRNQIKIRAEKIEDLEKDIEN